VHQGSGLPLLKVHVDGPYTRGEAAMLARCVLCTERRETDWVVPHDKAGVSSLGDGGACF